MICNVNHPRWLKMIIVQCVVQILKERKSLFIPIDTIQTSFSVYIKKKKASFWNFVLMMLQQCNLYYFVKL